MRNASVFSLLLSLVVLSGCYEDVNDAQITGTLVVKQQIALRPDLQLPEALTWKSDFKPDAYKAGIFQQADDQAVLKVVLDGNDGVAVTIPRISVLSAGPIDTQIENSGKIYRLVGAAQVQVGEQPDSAYEACQLGTETVTVCEDARKVKDGIADNTHYKVCHDEQKKVMGSKHFTQSYERTERKVDFKMLNEDGAEMAAFTGSGIQIRALTGRLYTEECQPCGLFNCIYLQ